MNSNLNQGTARIYQFPAGGRAALAGRRHADATPATNPGHTRINEAACGASWYHEEAIREAEATREH